MKRICTIVLCCTFGCSQSDSSHSTGGAEKQGDSSMTLEATGGAEEQGDSSITLEATGGAENQGDSSITLEDLVNVDMVSPDCPQIPLVCGTGRDFPTGRELAFRHVKSRETVHAVFPEGVSAPEDLDGSFTLHGHYQGIQNRREGYRVKNPPKDYRYSVVSSWEDRK